MTPLPTPQQLRYLTALAEHGHFGRAALRLRGDPVHPFGRHPGAGTPARRGDPGPRRGRQVVFTPLGLELIGRARTALAALDRGGGGGGRGARADERAAAAGRDPDHRAVPAAAADAGAARRLSAPAALPARGHHGAAGRAAGRQPAGRAAAGAALRLRRRRRRWRWRATSSWSRCRRPPAGGARAGAGRRARGRARCCCWRTATACATRRWRCAACCARARQDEFAATSLHTLVQMVAGGLGVTLLPRMRDRRRRDGGHRRRHPPPGGRRRLAHAGAGLAAKAPRARGITERWDRCWPESRGAERSGRSGRTVRNRCAQRSPLPRAGEVGSRSEPGEGVPRGPSPAGLHPSTSPARGRGYRRAQRLAGTRDHPALTGFRCSCRRGISSTRLQGRWRLSSWCTRMSSQRILHRAGAARQREQIGAAGNAAERARLHRGGADLLVAQHAEQLAEALDPLFQHALERLRRHVAAGDAGAAGGDHHVDRGIGDPAAQMRARSAPASSFSIARVGDAGGRPWRCARRARRRRCRSPAVRVSDTVSTAMLTGMNGRGFRRCGPWLAPVGSIGVPDSLARSTG